MYRQNGSKLRWYQVSTRAITPTVCTPPHPYQRRPAMPGHDSTPLSPAELDPQQVKVCSHCRAPVAQDIDYSSPHALDPDPISLCSVCRDRSVTHRIFTVPVARAVEFEVPRRPLIQQQQSDDSGHLIQFPTALDPGEFPCTPSTSDAAYSPRTQDPTHLPLKVKIPTDNSYHFRNPAPALEPASPSTSYSSSSTSYTYTPDPLIDITRLRVRAPTHHCLYPGATFSGTQKSGRNSYDVNVTIVVSTILDHFARKPHQYNIHQDVDFSSSFLCGYLRIRGLTEDWPELTTYFDAEIIGSRYGFLTRNWGATEQEDMVHWQRFPAFRQVKNDLKRPYLTIPENDRGAVFMRWKERFLVPDHRVQDINGASFAGM